jgi:NAD(P)-dependent dehydrogenase (short-subunit alcohol dehydrogenase family)
MGVMAAGASWTTAQIPDQTGRTVVVTGATSGLGLANTEELCRRGAHVVMAVRDAPRGERVAAELVARHPGARLEVQQCDLADLESVRAFADGLRRDGVEMEVLVNNAGVMFTPYRLTPQGHELQFATNHLGHFALTGLLLDLLADRKDPRVVTVASAVHRGGRIRFDDLHGSRRYSRFAAYAQSKLANVLFGLELDRRLRAAGSPVRSVLAHPGYTATNLQTSGPTGLAKAMGRWGNQLLAQQVGTGVLPQVYAATLPEVAGGQFIGPDGLLELRGRPRPVRPSAAGADPDTARRLWEVSEDLTGVRFGLPPATA